MSATTKEEDQTFDVYSVNTDDLAANAKTLHVLRHAQGYHNVNQEYRDMINLDARLTDLGKEQCEALAQQLAEAIEARRSKNDDKMPATAVQALAQSWVTATAATSSNNNNNDDATGNYDDFLIVSSPMTRCLQTATLSLAPLLKDIKIVAHDDIRETVNYNCDRRRPLHEIAAEFPHVDFSACDNNGDDDWLWNDYERRLGSDTDYPGHRESAELYRVADRGRAFLRWLRNRPERHVVICSHAAFWRCFWNYGHFADHQIPKQVPQVLDDRQRAQVPIVRYRDEAIRRAMVDCDFENCELRSLVMVFDAAGESGHDDGASKMDDASMKT